MSAPTIRFGRDDDRNFADQVRQRCGQDVADCQQCGKCTAGCPMSFLYDKTVNQLMRLIREGRKQEALASRSVWLCAACHACASRCPANINVSAVMETLRHMAREDGHAGVPDVKTFADVFLDVLERHGRVHEIETMLRYNLTSGNLLSGADLGPTALAKGKLHLPPPRVQGAEAVAEIIARYKKERAR